MPDPSLGLLSRLWLREPDSRTLEDCREVALPSADPAALAAAYADLFLLNVYPYGTAFTDPSGELGGPSAAWAARQYEEREFRPPELAEVGAPDHVGLGLGYLDHLATREEKDGEFSAYLAEWVPICCLAVERETSAHPFYRAVAAATRERLLMDTSAPERAFPRHSEEQSDEESEAPLKEPQIPRSARDDNRMPANGAEDEEEVGLSQVVRFLLSPARSGLFLSRAKLGQLAWAAGMRLPFAARFDVARALFQTAGESGRVGSVLDVLETELDAWETEYRGWASQHPGWAPAAARWLSRTAETRRRLGEMRGILENPPQLEAVIPWR